MDLKIDVAVRRNLPAFPIAFGQRVEQAGRIRRAKGNVLQVVRRRIFDINHIRRAEIIGERILQHVPFGQQAVKRLYVRIRGYKSDALVVGKQTRVQPHVHPAVVVAVSGAGYLSAIPVEIIPAEKLDKRPYRLRVVQNDGSRMELNLRFSVELQHEVLQMHALHPLGRGDFVVPIRAERAGADEQADGSEAGKDFPKPVQDVLEIKLLQHVDEHKRQQAEQQIADDLPNEGVAGRSREEDAAQQRRAHDQRILDDRQHAAHRDRAARLFRRADLVQQHRARSRGQRRDDPDDQRRPIYVRDEGVRPRRLDLDRHRRSQQRVGGQPHAAFGRGAAHIQVRPAADVDLVQEIRDGRQVGHKAVGQHGDDRVAADHAEEHHQRVEDEKHPQRVQHRIQQQPQLGLIKAGDRVHQHERERVHHQIRDDEMEGAACIIGEEQPRARDRLRMVEVQLLARVEVAEAGGKHNRQHRHHIQHRCRARQERAVYMTLQVIKGGVFPAVGEFHHPRKRVQKQQKHAPEREQPKLLGRELPEKAGRLRKAGF